MRIMREYVATMPAGTYPTQFVPMYQESHHTSFDVLNKPLTLIMND